MGSMSIWHWVIVIGVVLLLFGRGKISELMGDVAQGIKAFKKGMTEDESAKAEAAKTDPVKLSEGAPKGCEAKIGVPAKKPGEDAALESLQAQLGALGVDITKTIMVDCTGP